jgi:hypothetical protein
VATNPSSCPVQARQGDPQVRSENASAGSAGGRDGGGPVRRSNPSMPVGVGDAKALGGLVNSPRRGETTFGHIQ